MKVTVFDTHRFEKPILEELLREAAPHRPVGRFLSAAKQPTELPLLEERWKFVAATLAR